MYDEETKEKIKHVKIAAMQFFNALKELPNFSLQARLLTQYHKSFLDEIAGNDDNFIESYKADEFIQLCRKNSSFRERRMSNCLKQNSTPNYILIAGLL